MRTRESQEQTNQIQQWLAELDLSMYALKGVFKRAPQQIHSAITTDKYPTLKTKIYNYLQKRLESKNGESK